MNPTTIQLLYLAISIGITVWVAETLRRNGRHFVIEAFGGREDLGDAVNHLLVVGFYLINVGFVALFLTRGERPVGAGDAIEFLAGKIGVVLVVLGAMHFFNVFNLAKMRRKAQESRERRAETERLQATNEQRRQDERLLRQRDLGPLRPGPQGD
jgi:hypothetical protein